MAKFISIPTNATGQPVLLFNTDNVSAVVPPANSTATTCTVVSQGKTFTLTLGGSSVANQNANALAASNLINNAVTTAAPQPIVAAVSFPSITLTGGVGATLQTTITVASTAGLTPGMCLTIIGGTGVFATNTTIASITNSTQFVVSTAPTTALSGATISASVLSINTVTVG